MKIKLSEVELNYEVFGSGKPLIFLHGNGEDLSIYEALSEKLKETYTLYLVDSRNHGRSSKHIHVSYQAMADDMIEFIEVLSLNQPYLFGFSDGGIIGLLIAMKRPDMLGKLAIAGANLTPKGLRIKVIKAMEKVYQKTKDPLYLMMLSEPQIAFADIEKITIPTLILAGEKDMIRLQHTQAIAHHIKQSTLIIMKDRNHDNYVVHQSELKEICIEFFQ
jgi:pimeloyl-ACP methyl ester carboxylesterase